MTPSMARALRRLALVAALVGISSACSGTGCQGCTPQPIPGGFPTEHRFDTAMQVRLSDTGVGFLEKNFSSLVTMLVPTGLSFDIPPTGCTSTDQKICCPPSPACTATMSIASTKLTPTPQSTLKLNLRANVQTSKIKYEKSVPLLGWFSCDVTYSSVKAAPTTLGLLADVNFLEDSQRKLQISRGTTTLEDFDCNDIDITGSWYCTVVDWLCPLFQTMIEDQLASTVDSTLDGMLKSLPLGQESRVEVASFLSSFSPTSQGQLDYLLWGGGYAEAENAGMSIGALGGFRPAKYSTCVPNCEIAGASCVPPSPPAIPRSPVFRQNVRPDGKPFDVGIGVDGKTLEMAAYGLYASGGLCLDVSSRSVTQLSSATFGLLVPSISALTGAQTLPMMISVRPRQPPTVTLGKGTYHQDANGSVVIDDPLLKINAKDFALDIYLQLDERMVRLFTVVGQLELPVLLYADGSGRLQPMIGDLDKGFTNVRVESSELVTENPEDLAKAFPTVLALAAGFLGSSFSPIELPSVQKLKLLLDGGSVTSVDSNQVLAIFANLGLVQTTKLSGPLPTGVGEEGAGQVKGAGQVRAWAVQVELWVPPTEAFRLGPAFRSEDGPRLTLRVGAEVPPALAGQPLEWTYRVDGGFFRPWTSGSRLVARDPLFWLQGEHTIEVIARIKDRPETTSQPVQRRVLIDTMHAAAPTRSVARVAAASGSITAAEQGGCSVGGRVSSLGGLALLGLALLFLRRRRA